MTQPFDNRDWNQRQIAEKDAEIERLKAVVEDLSDHGVAAERMALLKAQSAEIERLNKLYRASLELLGQQGMLLTRAADALEDEFGPPSDPAYGVKGPVHELIAELRHAVK